MFNFWPFKRWRLTRRFYFYAKNRQGTTELVQIMLDPLRIFISRRGKLVEASLYVVERRGGKKESEQNGLASTNPYTS